MDPQSNHLSATAGLVERPVIAADLRVCERQVIRYEKMGMPALHLGKRRYYDPLKVREWILTFEKRPQKEREEPKIGRPARRRA
jgi:hypothetical protein